MTTATPLAERKLNDAARGSSFHRAMLLLPKARRRALLTLYALCRLLDDAVDEAASPAAAHAALDAWEADIRTAFAGGAPRHPLAQDFAQMHRGYRFDPAQMHLLLAALRMDADGRMLRPPLAMLERYCHGVAGVPGLMSMRIFGCEGAQAQDFALALGHGLQLTNILRDVRKDALLGRIYLPDEWLDASACLTDLSSTQPACRRLAETAAGWFRAADDHAQHLPIRAIAPALAMRDVYALYWQKLAALGWQAPENGHLPLDAREKAWLAGRATAYLAGRFKPVALG